MFTLCGLMYTGPRDLVSLGHMPSSDISFEQYLHLSLGVLKLKHTDEGLGYMVIFYLLLADKWA